jgi:xylan 1,4-beta-xylosidase
LEPVAKTEDGQLVLSSPAERGTDLFGSVVAVQTTTGNYAATTLLAQTMQAGSKAGLFAFGDRANAIGVVVGGGKAELIRLKQGKNEGLAAIDFPAVAKTYLRTEVKEGHRFSFFVWDGKDWKRVGDADLEGDYLPPWDRGVRIALTIGGQENATARFEWLRVVPKAD